MALLTIDQRKRWMKFVGYEYSRKGILKMQQDYFPRQSDHNGLYDPDTDALLRHLRNVKKFAPSFRPEEFRCGCGGKYCTGYPTRMKVRELKHIQAIRDHYRKPMRITCGLRCKKFNSTLKGASPQSFHLRGLACDFYIPGVTDTLKNRKRSIKWIRKLPGHHYTYGNGIYAWGADGSSGPITALGMGNALHTDVE